LKDDRWFGNDNSVRYTFFDVHDIFYDMILFVFCFYDPNTRNEYNHSVEHTQLEKNFVEEAEKILSLLEGKSHVPYPGYSQSNANTEEMIKFAISQGREYGFFDTKVSSNIRPRYTIVFSGYLIFVKFTVNERGTPRQMVFENYLYPNFVTILESLLKKFEGYNYVDIER